MMTDSLRTRRFASRTLSLALGLIVLSTTSACLSHRIKVRASNDEAFVRARTLFVIARPPSDPGGGAPEALDPIALRDRVEDELRAKGYATASEAEAELVLEAAPAIESVSRRTWTSDTDATAPRLVTATDLVFVLRAVDRDGDLTLWSCEARLPLPVNELPGAAPDFDALWRDLVERALAKIPARRGP